MLSNFGEPEEMKAMNVRFSRKLKLGPTITSLKQGLVLQLSPTNIFCTQDLPTPPIYDDQDHKGTANNNLAELDDEHFEEAEMDLEFSKRNKDKVKSTMKSNDTEEIIVASAFSGTKMEHYNGTQEAVQNDEYEYPSLKDFKEVCPPVAGGGSQSVILYTTSLRGIRKTFQDCNTIRFLLRSFRVLFQERDVSLHLEYREELWRLLGGSRVIPPKLFIKGRYIGGADEVVGLHEMGILGKLLEGTPIDFTQTPCKGCANMRFAICSACSGSCKLFTNTAINGKMEHDHDLWIRCRCPQCNENGLVKCPICC
ncbi:hypothetical protein L6164_009531 [Bauhinia variegata]|uniref:Uncharacterized protein n=1 Tax=Bauhinia variegata TaxID=167791 RepID=A0ACB9PK13_BAUVA|nr:hypothetical protein L6164_009531 [Bauhinia variegata]